MKGSDSSTSLTQLRDTGCSICNEGVEEKGEELVDSKNLIKCGCQYVVHLSCWNTHLETENPTCIQCTKLLVPPYIIRAIEVSGEEQLHKSRVGISYKSLGLLLLVFFCFLGFIIALIVSFHR
jgi:hypothetical protein